MELTAECPEVINTAFNFQLDTSPEKTPDFESAMCLHDLQYWEYVTTRLSSPFSGLSVR